MHCPTILRCHRSCPRMLRTACLRVFALPCWWYGWEALCLWNMITVPCSGYHASYPIQFITTLTIISFSSGLDSAIIIVSATRV